MHSCISRCILAKWAFIEIVGMFVGYYNFFSSFLILGFTAKNAVLSPNFLVWKFCGKAQFRIVSGESPKTMRKLCLSIKFPHQEIRWKYGIFAVFWLQNTVLFKWLQRDCFDSQTVRLFCFQNLKLFWTL